MEFRKKNKMGAWGEECEAEGGRGVVDILFKYIILKERIS